MARRIANPTELLTPSMRALTRPGCLQVAKPHADEPTHMPGLLLWWSAGHATQTGLLLRRWPQAEEQNS